MSSTQYVEGLSELLKALKELPNKMANNVVTKTLRAVGSDFRDKVRQRAPALTGTLRRNIIRKDGKRRKLFQSQIVMVKKISKKSLAKQKAAGATGRYKGDSWYAYIVHWGAKSHTIKPKHKKYLSGKGYERPIKKLVHPGLRANKFMLRAWMQERNRVLDKIYFGLIQGVENEARKMRKGPKA